MFDKSYFVSQLTAHYQSEEKISSESGLCAKRLGTKAVLVQNRIQELINRFYKFLNLKKTAQNQKGKTIIEKRNALDRKRTALKHLGQP